MQLVQPSLDRLPGYVAALKRGWSPDNVRGIAASIDELAQIEKDASSFVEHLTDREAKGPPVVLPDGSLVARLPGYRLWLWDDEFCGSVASRRVIEVNGGVLIERFRKPAQYGACDGLRFRIDL